MVLSSSPLFCHLEGCLHLIIFLHNVKVTEFSKCLRGERDEEWDVVSLIGGKEESRSGGLQAPLMVLSLYVMCMALKKMSFSILKFTQVICN